MNTNANNSEMNFSIQDTMEFGGGSAQLVNDLLAPETQTAKPEEVTAIVKEVAQTTNTETTLAPVKEIIVPGETPSAASLVSSFLSDDDENDETNTTGESTTDIPSTTTEQTTSATGKEENFSKFKALAKDLTNLGVFTTEEGEDDEEIETPEQFLERFNTEKKKGASEIVQNFIGQFGEDYQQAFDAIFVKGVNPKDYFSVYNTVVNFAELDLTSEDNQTKVMKQSLIDQGWETEDIDTEIERLKQYGDLETVATRNHKVLIKKEAQKLSQMEETSQRELQQKAQIRNQYITNVQGVITEKLKTKELDGIPLNAKLAQELQDFLLVDKWKTASGETLSDFDRFILDLKRPENHAAKVKLGLLIKVMEKDPTFSTLQKTGVSKKSNEMFSEFTKQNEKSPSSTAAAKQGASSDDWKFGN